MVQCPDCKRQCRTFKKLVSHHRNEHLVKPKAGKKYRRWKADVVQALLHKGVRP